MQRRNEPAGEISRRVVVTGIGAVSPFGWTAGSLREGLKAGRPAIGPFETFDHSGHRTHLAGSVPRPPADLLRALRPLARVSSADLFALAAAREAVRQAGLDTGGPDGEAGVFFGSSTGGLFEGERFYEAALRTGGRRFRLSLLASQQYNGPGDAVARGLGTCGPVVTISSACSSGAMAIGAAREALVRGELRAAVAGGSDSLCRITYGGFNALRAVDEGPCRPFREDRQGLSLGEGAAVVVLEPLEAARARGARPLAEVRGAGASCDARHMTAPDPSGGGAARAIRVALADAGIAPEEVDFVNAHGTGTPLNDVSEWESLRAVFGERAGALPVTSTKALVGHLLGSAGALEAVATLLGLRERLVHPMPPAGAPDPAIPARLVLGEPLPLPRARHALSVSLAFGGANAALVLTRWDGEGPDA